MGFNRNLGNIPQVITELNGNIGIGTTNPESTLVVQKNVSGGRGGELSIVNYATSVVGAESALNFGVEESTYGNNNCNFQIKAYLNNINGATDAVFSNWSGTAFSSRMRITSDGKVGVGTDAPPRLFSVSTNTGNLVASTTVIAITSGGQFGSIGTPKNLDLAFLGNANNELARIRSWDESYSTGYGALSFFVNNASALSERMRIFPNGNVVIGSSPTDAGYKLNVSGPTRIQGNLGVDTTLYGINNVRPGDNGYGGIDFFNSGIGYQYSAKIYTFKTSTEFYGLTNDFGTGTSGQLSIVSNGSGSSNIGIYTNATERIRITGGGETYIQAGTGYQVRIQPNCQINTTLNGGGASMYLNYQGNGAIYAGSSYAVLYAGSDRRIKTDIKDAESTLNKILNLTPRTFRYKERPNDVSYGFIAQEVEEVMPEIVKTSEGISNCAGEEIVDQKSIESYGLAWASILVKAIQEQQEIIKQLTNRIINLENK